MEFLVALLLLGATALWYGKRKRDDDDHWRASGGPGGFKIS